MAHFIHYIRRRVRFSYTQKKTSFWFAEVQSNKAGLDRPRYHITRSKIGVASEIKSGDIIWLIAQLYSPSGSLPPAVDARIDVECSSMIRGKGAIVSAIAFKLQRLHVGFLWLTLQTCCPRSKHTTQAMEYHPYGQNQINLSVTPFSG